MTAREKGYSLVMVLIFLAVGSLMIAPTLRLAQTALKSKQRQTTLVKEQYARDAGVEYGMWELQYGEAISKLISVQSPCTSTQCTYTLTLNGISTQVIILKRTEQGSSESPGRKTTRYAQPRLSSAPRTKTGYSTTPAGR